MQGAVVAEIANAEEHKRMKKLRPSGNNLQHIEPAEPPSATATPSSGFLDALRRPQERAPEPVAPQHQQSGVVVNVGNSGIGPAGDIDRIATYVAAGGNSLERETRLRIAVNILRDSATNDEERKVLAARLDAAVAAKTKTENDSDSGVARTARIAFDKLADLWKGL